MDTLSRHTGKRHAFTLVELLVVIAIIGILIGMLLPAVQQVREAARRTQCLNNIRQLALAAHNYESAFGKFPEGFHQEFLSGGSSNVNGYQGHSVFYHLLPYMEAGNVYDGMDPITPKANIDLDPEGQRSAASIPTFVCPSSSVLSSGEPEQYETSWGDVEWYGVISYRANGGERPIYATDSTNDGMFMAVGPDARKAPNAPEGVEVKMGAIADGTSNTILFGEFNHNDPNWNTFEAAGIADPLRGWSRWYPAKGDRGLGNILAGAHAPINFQIPWAHGEPGAPTGGGSQWYPWEDLRLSAFGSEHPGGATFAYADGSTHFKRESTAQNVLRLICERADGQVIAE